MYFKHLEDVNQTYFEHFKDSIRYSFLCLKTCFYFLIHSIYPDLFIKSGSDQIKILHDEIQRKYKKL